MNGSTRWDEFALNESAHRGTFPVLQKLVAMWVAEAENVLELGCTSGVNIQFFALFGKYHGIDISEEAVKRARAAHPLFSDTIVQGDFTQAIPFDTEFDVIVDRASVCHNDSDGIRRAVGLAFEKLKPGGLYISSDWFSIRHSECRRGHTLEESLWGRTAGGYTDGQFRGVGKVRFSSEQELAGIFGAFERLLLHERISRRMGPGFAPFPPRLPWIGEDFAYSDYQSAVWDLVARKPG